MQQIGLNIYRYIDKTGKFIINKILGIFNIQISDKQWESFMQFFKFGLVGLSNTLISYLLYIISIFLGATPLQANFIGFTISVLNSFYWNNKFVFKKEKGQQRSLLKSLIKTYMSYAITGIFLNSILLLILVNYFNISKYFAPLIILIITIPINYILNKIWAFK